MFKTYQTYSWRIIVIVLLLGILIGSEGAFAQTPPPPLIQNRSDLRLMQPLDDSTWALAPSDPGQLFLDYFKIGAAWLFGVAAGIAILNTLFGGIQILFSGGDPSKRSEGVTRLLWSIGGLLILSFAGFILRLINPLFYT
jgi:hypothetical protein